MNSEDHFSQQHQTEKKSTMVEADTKPASSLSNGIDNVLLGFHLDTFSTNKQKK